MHKCVVGLGYGDEGKGTVVNRLCATGDYSAVVRFNGGCQAAHNVVLDDGRHHTFAQFGSGTLQGVPTHLSQFMMVEPLSLMNEAEGLKKIGVPNPLYLLTIHPKALITTPYHWLVNRYREDQRGDARHGSCGRGVGATAEYALQNYYALRIEDLKYEGLVIRKLLWLEDWAIAHTDGNIEIQDIVKLSHQYLEFANQVVITKQLPTGNLVFEGAQGVLLDEHVGFHPYTTWATCTPDNVFKLVDSVDVEVIGVTRTYMTRHGAGPLVTEDKSLNIPDVHNEAGQYQGAWRVGHMDIPALNYAIDACGGIDKLYVTHVDVQNPHVFGELKICVAYDSMGIRRRLFLHESDDLATREAQTYMLSHFQPVYQEGLGVGPHIIASLLDVPLYGYGIGPRTSDEVRCDSLSEV